MNKNSKIGKLILVETKQKPNNKIIIWGDNLKKNLFINIEDDDVNFERLSKSSYTCFQPIIISDDEIQVGDNIINGVGNITNVHCYNNDLKKFQYIISGALCEVQSDDKKIIVLSNQFSSEFLQAIVDGKIKDRDKVEVEMIHLGGTGSGYVIKLRKDCTAIIHPYIESVEEKIKKLNPYNDENMWGAWIEGFRAAIE